MRVCLASTSPARRMLLRQFGIHPLTVAPAVDEEAVIAAVEDAEGRVLPPAEHVLLLARRKAADAVAQLAARMPDFDGIVIGGDSMFDIDGRVLGKPGTPENALARWHEMRGRTGVLHSGHAVFRVRPGEEALEVHDVAEASVTFAADVTDAEISAYVASGEPLHVAGAFTVDSLGGAFITRVEGDPSTVIGMSLSTLRRLVRDLGVEWTSLWNSVDPSVRDDPAADGDARGDAPVGTPGLS
ncbi:nucleoside triphosphate pyrophosphatase [Microbacterium sp. ARD31]|jgi:septum formation protein|uniref:Maf family protein n=1 Tax=Microbacterium sp. ARD31 TaxID=2962576 RepID=UPI0028813BFB|nr:nucleoside triphosphate pyrophosphatase [Microbacterium sp. ARD31]MDT0187643.1 nucleoside triphosphate pyrophosphatase [Microbacterium sp. ARD31]